MNNNQILKKLKDILDIQESEIKMIYDLIDYPIPLKRIEGYLKDKDDKDYLDCGAEALGNFLDALIVYKRGPNKNKTDNNEQTLRLTNNLILKKLRVAFELKDSHMYEIFDAAKLDITKGELSALFRSEKHKKFRSCPDSVLELFLEGLDITQHHKV